MPDKTEVEDVLDAIRNCEDEEQLRDALLTATEELAELRDTADDALNDIYWEV